MLYPRVARPVLLLALAAASLPAYAGAPSAAAVSASMNEDGTASITLRGSDPDRNSMTYSIVTNPGHGSVSVSGAVATYRPTANYNGTDTFVYRVKDSTGLYSGNATVTVTIAAVNDTPTAASVSVTASEDTALSTSLTGTDVDGDALTFSITTAPSQGSVSVSGSTGVAVYTPPANWSGSTSYKYQVSDGRATAGGTISITVAAVNDAPVGTASSFTLGEDTSASIPVSATDVDSSTLTYALATGPAHGTASISGRNVTYTPTANYSGADSFTFTANDGSATSAPATVSLTVSAVNDAPTTSAVSGTTNEDTPWTGTLPGTDVDGDRLTWQLVAASNGSATVDSSGRVTFTPTANFHGAAWFSYQVSDGTALSAVTTGTITVNSVNDVPVPTAQTVSLNEDNGPTSISLSATDADNDALTYSLVNGAAHGTVAIAGRTAVYTPNADWNGTDTFTFTAVDASSAGSSATVTLNVTAVNDAPVAYGSAAMTDGRTITLTIDATDIDSTVSAPTLSVAPTHGTASVSGNTILYTPAAGWLGVDRLTWSVSDGTSSASAQVKVSSIGSWSGAHAQWSQVGVNSMPFYGDASGTVETASATFQGSYILDDLESLGGETYRQLRNADLTWGASEPNNGAWQLDDTDELVFLDEIEPRFTLFETSFASPTPPWATTPAEFQKGMNADAYDYVDTVVNRYADSARYWEIGNEMYHWFALDTGADPSTISELPASYPTGGYTPEEQAEFLRDAALRVKALDPDAIIVLPAILAGSATTDEWLERVVTHTGSDWFDVVTYHAYEEWQYTRGARPDLEDELQFLGLEDKLVQLTETGSSCYADQTAKTDYPNDTTTQASDVFRLLLPAFAAGDAQVDWHTYRELSAYDLTAQGGDALFAYDTSPRPAAYTMQLLTSELLPIVQVTDLSTPTGGVYHYEVRSLDGSVHHVYWGTATTTVPGGVTQATSVVVPSTGVIPWSAVTAGSALALTSVPVLLR